MYVLTRVRREIAPIRTQSCVCVPKKLWWQNFSQVILLLRLVFRTPAGLAAAQTEQIVWFSGSRHLDGSLWYEGKTNGGNLPHAQELNWNQTIKYLNNFQTCLSAVRKICRARYLLLSLSQYFLTDRGLYILEGRGVGGVCLLLGRGNVKR